ncbi:aldehyde dehydrogenase family protein [Kutzneria kofuensis]|uniref:Acyl-CoA reductase-like NAD-dependent aldehyde dehydrogenase n=1 Tax=Kutzneria kofuensis TaxID=103725 RepID=A0A7W9KMU5_9PSEU|nr:aldehyde dehydrogenase family protein [Kutzneria kofuensis]MBB5895457.1 acyl-CoA reductase-like NAD-dependent aldehyde dehydrogenase [Kutzneria kofuensis]
MASAIADIVSADALDFAADGAFDVVNPATGEVFAQAPQIGDKALDSVFATAQNAFQHWRRDEGARRAALRAAADAVEQRAGELAPVLTAEQGKPINEAAEEVWAAAAWLRYYADLEVPREVIQDDAEAYQEVVRRPLGVVAAITPWNFPLALAAWKIAPALRAGNTIVLKPSPFTPLATLALGQALRGVFPDGVLSVVTGRDPLGAAMVAHPVPRKVSFTGSTATGKKVAASAADDLKRVTLELGGNDPAIVLPDVDVAEIAPQLFWGAFRNNGQVCLAVKRVYAHESIHADLVEALAGIAASIKVDDGTVDGAQLGPINNRPQFDRVTTLVSDALHHGARAVTGGAPLDRPGYFYAPTILDGVDDGIRIVDEEQFGPVLPVLSYRDEADAVARANRTNYGLTASVWSGDPDRALTLAADIDSGQVSINSHGAGVRPHLPFGGHKWSGLGVENGPWGLYGFTELQVIAGPPRRK